MPLPPDFDPLAPCPEPFNLAEYVLSSAAAEADKIALEIVGPDHTETWSYADLRAAVARYAAAIRAHGVHPGDTVLMRVGNTVEFPLVFLACIAAGFVPVPTSAALTLDEVNWIARDLSPAVCIKAPDMTGPSHIPILTLAELDHGAHATECNAVPGPVDRLAYVVYTSGSSGQPRAVAHAHRAIWARRMMWQGWYGMGPEDRVLHAGAFNWTYTLGVGLMDPWAIGATAVIPVSGTQSATLPRMLSETQASIFAAAPGVYRQILKSDMRMALPALRHGLSAGEALPATVRNGWRQRTGTEIYEALGMSECSTFVSARPGRQAPEGASGFAQPGRRIAALDPSGVPITTDAPGVLGIDRHDPGLMLGYLENGVPRLPLIGDWFVTGDMVSIDPDGAVRYLGRGDDMMNAGGFRVSPVEVESAFQGFAGVSETAAVEVAIRPDVTVIALFYASPHPIDAAELEAEAARHLARYKQPRLYIHRETLPKGSNGKLSRRALRATYEAHDDQA